MEHHMPDTLFALCISLYSETGAEAPTTINITISLDHYRSHTGPLIKKNTHSVLNVFDTFKLELGVFMYNHQTNSLLQTFSDYFIKHSQVHNYPTRNAQDYRIYKAKKVFADRAI